MARLVVGVEGQRERRQRRQRDGRDDERYQPSHVSLRLGFRNSLIST
jgi:hypothetical protein